MIRKVFKKIYADYLLLDQFSKFDQLIELAVKEEYQVLSVIQFFDLIKTRGLEKGGRYLINRHDVDTDPVTARKFYDIEKNRGVFSSFYFRLSTLDHGFIRDIQNYGSEVGYHFEEIATFCKENRVKKKEIVFRQIHEIKKTFVENFKRVSKDHNLEIRSVSSHGDFVNKKIGILNHYLLDPEIRTQLRIEVETYDTILLDHVTARHNDDLFPKFKDGNSPIHSIRNNEPVIYLLTHPRDWQCNCRINTIENLKRLYEGVKFHMNFER